MTKKHNNVEKEMKKLILVLGLFSFFSVTLAQSYDIYDNTYNYGLIPKQNAKPNPFGRYNIYDNTYDYSLTTKKTTCPNRFGDSAVSAKD